MAARVLLGFLLALAVLGAAAEQPVYREVDPRGSVVYTDRPERSSAPKVKMWTPANPSPLQYDAALTQSDADRMHYERLRAEDRRPRPVLLYSPSRPGGFIAPSGSRTVPPSTPHRFRWDPSLPDSQPPTLERRYYYEGR